MRKLFAYLVLLVMLPTGAYAGVAIDEEHFPDPILREAVKGFDTGDYWDKKLEMWVGANDGFLGDGETARVWWIGASGVSDLTGLNYLPALEQLGIDGCKLKKLTRSDLSGNPKVRLIISFNSELEEIDLAGMSSLEEIHTEDCKLKELKLNGCKSLRYVLCSGNQLKELNLSGCSAMTELYCMDNELESVNISGCSSLKLAHFERNKITAIDAGSCKSLVELWAQYNRLEKINVSNSPALEQLCLYSNDLTAIDVTRCPRLVHFWCMDNHLHEIDLSNNQSLSTSYCNRQTSSGLRVKAVANGYEVNMKDYVSDVQNIDVSSFWGDRGSARFLSYDGVKGTVLFDKRPSELYYVYKTKAPGNSRMDVTIKSSMNVDVIERGGPTENIIYGITDKNYLDAADTKIGEDSIAGLSGSKYRKKGFAADGNSRLIVRVQSTRPGNVAFTLKDNIGIEMESLSNRAKIASVLHTSSVGRDGYQSSAVLVAPEMYPSGKKFPSDKFTVHVKFTADDTGENIPDDEKVMEEDIELEIHAAPVLLLRGFFGSAAKGTESTFDKGKDKGIWQSLKDNKFNVAYMNHDGRIGPSKLLSHEKNPVFNTLVELFYSKYLKEGIVCTKADIVAFGLGGITAKRFCTPETALFDGNYYTFRSYKRGMVRRIITIATPHRGTTWANYMLGDFGKLSNNLPTSQIALLKNMFLSAEMLSRLIMSGLDIFGIKTGLADDALYDMAVGSEIVGSPYPVNVPMHSIYGQSMKTLQLIVGVTAQVLDGIPILVEGGKILIEGGKYLSDFQKFLHRLNATNFVVGNSGATFTLINPLTDKKSILGRVQLLVWDYMRTNFKGFDPNNVFKPYILMKALEFADWAISNPIMSGILQIAQFALSRGVVSLVSLSVQNILDMLEETLFFGEDNDYCVSISSAGGDFAGYSTAFSGLFWDHFSIAHRQETADKIISLLKGPKSSFKVFDKLQSPGAYRATPPVVRDSSGGSFAERFTITVTPSLLAVKDKGEVRITAKSDATINEDFVNIVIQKDGENRIFPAQRDDNGIFEVTVSFTSRDIGFMKVLCFCQGDGDNLYISNSANFAVTADNESAKITGLSFTGTDGVIFADTGSEIPAGLTAQTSDGFTFDVSSPAMGTKWTSSNPTMAYVTDDGMIHVLSDGSALLTAEYNGLTASITVNAGEITAPHITSNILDKAPIRTAYSFQITASGTGPLTWRVISGRFPAGLEMSESGLISGVVEAPGEYPVRVQVSNIEGSDEKEFTLTVEDESKEFPYVPSQELPNATAGMTYTAEIKAIGGGITWTVSGLPAGLSFDAGIISGTPSEAGTFYITVKVMNSYGQSESMLVLFITEKSSGCTIDESTFPDEIFRAYVSANFDLDSNGLLDAEEISAITEINIDGQGIATLTGIENFKALSKLSCSNNKLKTLAMSANTALEELKCNNNSLRSIEVSGCKRLKVLEVSANSLQYLNLSANSELHTFSCMHNSFAALNISSNSLWNFWCDLQYVTEYPMTAPGRFDLKTAGLKAEDFARISNVTAEEYSGASLNVKYDSSTGIIEFEGTPHVVKYVYSVPYKKLVWDNALAKGVGTPSEEAMNVSVFFAHVSAPSITTVSLPDAKLNTDYSALLEASGGGITWTASGLPSGLSLSGGMITGVPQEKGTFTIKVTASNSEGSDTAEFALTVKDGGAITILDGYNFPDSKFMDYVMENFDTDQNGTLSNEEIANVIGINVAGMGISSLEGIEIFTGLTHLNCERNNITSLNVSMFPNLKTLICNENMIKSLDVSKNPLLEYLYCVGNSISSLNLTDNRAIIEVFCWSNDMHELTLGECPALTALHCHENPLTRLDVTGCPALLRLYCFVCSIEALDLTKCVSLVSLDAAVNKIQTIDTSKNKAMRSLCLNENPLKSVNLSANVNLEDIAFWCNELTALDVSSCKKLRSLNCSCGHIERLDLSKNTELETLDCSQNNLVWLNIDNCGKLKSLSCWGNKIPSLNTSGCPKLTEFNHDDYTMITDGSVPDPVNSSVKPSISAKKLPDGAEGKYYEYQLVASGTLPIKWTLKGKLPDGLKMSESGLISGTPTKARKYTFTVTATNDYGNDQARNISITVNAPVIFTLASLKDATVGKKYNVSMKMKGTKPVTWSAEGLPNGFTIGEKNGKISGTPSTHGTYSVKITAENDAGTTEKTYTFKINAVKPKLSGSLKRAELNQTYYSALKLSAGSEPITWSLEGTLPDGLTFNESTGVIRGIPTSYSRSGFNLVITAENDAGKVSRKIRLNVKGKAPRITTTKLNDATQGKSYSATLTATGSETITWSVDSATLPAGLTLDGDKITGTPTVYGKRFTITVYASNPVGTVKKNISLRINQAAQNGQWDVDSLPEIVSSLPPAMTDNIDTENHSQPVIVARLGEISCDVAGMYDFDVALSDDADIGAKLVYMANSDKPSDDDAIAEFFDDTGKEILAVPESRQITISVWLNPETIYNPEIATR